MALPNLGALPSPTAANMTSSSEDPSKKVRKPYTITKSRENWTEPEHDKFLEALQLFDRDWKKIEAFVGSKTAIQIRSHAQKYFLKVQKSGTSERLPPPRPKRKAAHPYPQKAPKIVVSQSMLSFQASPAVPETGIVRRSDSSSLPRHPHTPTSLPVRTDKYAQTTSLSHVARDDVRSTGQPLPNVYSCIGNECTPKTRSTVLPDFAQVYSFIGSVFDPNVTGHLQKLKKMDPIDIETILLLIRNLSINLASPEFEDHRKPNLEYSRRPEQMGIALLGSNGMLGQAFADVRQLCKGIVQNRECIDICTAFSDGCATTGIVQIGSRLNKG